MTSVELPVSPSPHFAETLAQAAIAFRQGTPRPPAASVVAALLAAEKATRQGHTRFSLEAIAGRWRLCFATGVKKNRQGVTRVSRGFYLPQWIPAYISFTPGMADRPGVITNQIALAGLRLKFTGPCRYQAKKNLLAFDFTQLQLDMLGATLYRGDVRGGKAQADNFEQRAIAQLPFFAFFQVTEDYIAARGRGGGLALWIRDNSPSGN